MWHEPVGFVPTTRDPWPWNVNALGAAAANVPILGIMTACKYKRTTFNPSGAQGKYGNDTQRWQRLFPLAKIGWPVSPVPFPPSAAQTRLC